MKFSFTEINDITGFANGDLFDDEEQVREYFTPKVQTEMFGHDAETSDVLLDQMAEEVIEHRWHMSTNPISKMRQAIRAPKAQKVHMHFPTGIPELDEAMSQGIPADRVSKFFGKGDVPNNVVNLDDYRIKA